MTVTQELDAFEVFLGNIATQEQRDYEVMLESRDRSIRARDLTGTVMAEDWLGRHGMPVDERRTCVACLTWSEGIGHGDCEPKP